METQCHAAHSTQKPWCPVHHNLPQPASMNTARTRAITVILFLFLFFSLLFDLLLFSPRLTPLRKKLHYHSRFLSVSFENTCATLPEKLKLTVSPVLNFSVVSVMGTMMITSFPSAVMCR